MTEMFKQVCFFRKRPDMTMEEFIDYYENQHSRLSERLGRSPSIPNAVDRTPGIGPREARVDSVVRQAAYPGGTSTTVAAGLRLSGRAGEPPREPTACGRSR